MRTVADVVVVGAGIVGCSIAYYLTQLDGTRVIVVEKGAIASGMTKRSGGLIRVDHPWQAEARLAVASLDVYRNWKDAVGGQCGFTQTGFARIARGEAAQTALRDQVAMLRQAGAAVEWLSAGDLHTLAPAFRVDASEAAAYVPAVGYVDPIVATQALAARAKDRGAVFLTGTFVKRIQVDLERVSGLDTNSGPIECLSVIVAAGPWSDRLLKPLGAQLGMETQLAQVVFFDRPPALKTGHIAFVDDVSGAYCRPHTYGLTLGGVGDRAGDSNPNPDQFDPAVQPSYVELVQQRLAERIPDMAHARFIRGHTGLYDYSPDGHAVLDRVPGIHGLVVAAGFGGIGSALAPAVGAAIAELVNDSVARSSDLEPFRFGRGGQAFPA